MSLQCTRCKTIYATYDVLCYSLDNRYLQKYISLLYMMFVYASTVFTSNLSGAFTFALAWGAGLEEWTIGKIAGILVCFLGVVLVSLQDSNGDGGNDDGGSSSSSSGDHAVSGDILAILAAFGYGLYTTMIRYKVRCRCS